MINQQNWAFRLVSCGVGLCRIKFFCVEAARVLDTVPDAPTEIRESASYKTINIARYRPAHQRAVGRASGLGIRGGRVHCRLVTPPNRALEPSGSDSVDDIQPVVGWCSGKPQTHLGGRDGTRNPGA